MNDKHEKEEKILAAAKKSFIRFGPNKATIDDIAKEAGLGKGTIYLYFKSKEEIFRHVVDVEAATMYDNVCRAIKKDAPSAKKLEQCVLAILETLMDLMTDHGATFEIFAECKFAPEFAKSAAYHRKRMIELIKSILDDGISKGEFETADTLFQSTIIATTVEALEKSWIWENQGASLSKNVKSLTEFFIHGLKHRS